ncbi:MAG: helicase-related protein, partial [bacterium]
VLAAVAAADSGFQTAIIVPSLLVARQHADTISNLTRKSNIRVGLLTGESQSAELYNAMHSGAVDIIIGTQALLSNRVEFKNLGLLIIDEQHLMGVNQRLKLPKKEGAHVLLLSATPIPRSTALALFGDLDLVEMRDYPKSRAGTSSYLREESRREAIWDFIEERISAGERAFVVHPRIEGEDFSALEYGFQRLRERFGNRVGFVHGGLDEVSKNRAIEAFRSGEISILAATTVVSVGIDIPEASVMLIEGADNFGLAQLHQLRGRVGRADKAGYCILLTSKLKGSNSYSRLSRFTKTEDGFEISQIDLEERREGELLNIIQSGKNSFDFADPLQMPFLLEDTKRIAERIFSIDPELKLDKNSALREIIHYIENSGEVVVTLA